MALCEDEASVLSAEARPAPGLMTKPPPTIASYGFPGATAGAVVDQSSPSGSASVLPNPSELNDDYLALGCRRGVEASARAREEMRTRWISREIHGAVWLLLRAEDETDHEAVTDVASILADIGRTVVPVLLALLNTTPSHSQVLIALKALSWLSDVADPTRAAKAIRHHAASDSPEIREAAYCATACLPIPEAAAILQEAVEEEPDPDAKLVAVEELAARRRG